MDAILIEGQKEPTRFCNARGVHYKGSLEALEFAKTQGWVKVGVAYSGLYYELRSDGWWKTSNSDVCDRIHGLPSKGVKL